MTFAAIATVDTLASALAPVDALVDETRVHCQPSGLSISAVDPANVGQVAVDLDGDACEHYEASGTTIGVALDRFLDVVALGDSSDLVHLDLDADSGQLHIDVGVSSYTLGLVDPGSIREEPTMPDLGLPVEVTVLGSDLDHAVSAAGLAGDHVTVGADADRAALTVRAEGDIDDVETALPEDELVSGGVGASVATMISLEYLDPVTGPIDADHEVTLSLGADRPVEVTYERCEGHCAVEHRLAPRIPGGDE